MRVTMLYFAAARERAGAGTETLELAERQKTADEQEIESLRRALRPLQRPRDSARPSFRPPEPPPAM